MEQEAGRTAQQAKPEDLLVSLARRAIETYVRLGQVTQAELPGAAGPPQAGVFVSLHLPDGSLRGCLGTIAPTRGSLAEEIVANATAAATRDPRFLAVSAAELPHLHICVDVLHEPEEVGGLEDLDPGRYGVILRAEDGRQALLLPSLEGVETPEQQIRLTCRKASIHPERDSYRMFRFEVTRHG